jgi:Domain of Unknown Function with PDB structure (DUF3857)/Transglutaminase-like superfamily
MQLSRSLFAFCSLSLLLGCPSTYAVTWRPVTSQELALRQSAKDPTADAEGLFRDVRVLNESAGFGYPHNVMSEYVRLKIFTERGKKYGTVEIPYWGNSIVSNVAGRTIRPDGSIVELGKDAIFDKVIAKKNGKKVKVKSFVMPAVEPGAVIEYKWNLNVGEFISRYVPLDVQSEFPTDEVTFHIKPVSSDYVAWPTMRYIPFNCTVERGATDMEGFSVLTVRNVPAFHEEPLMPPEYSAKEWVLVYYEENTKSSRPEQYWKTYGHELYQDYSQKIKINKDVKQIAVTAIGDAKTDEERIANLLAYCRKNLHNTQTEEIMNRQRGSSKEYRTTIDTLRQGNGSPQEIAYAFAALVTAAGFEARVARLSDRGTFFFSPDVPSAYFLNAFDIAVKINGNWKFYDVASRNLPPGVLSWREEGVPALIVDGKDSRFVTTPIFSADESQIARFGTLKLSSDGDLEGDVHEIFMGNKATEQRDRFALSNDAEREDELRNQLKQRFASFEVSKVKFTGLDDLTKAVGLTYHVKIDGYAQHTAKRLFLKPAYFQAGIGSFFTSDSRELPIYFEYPWSESDVVTIQFPEGYQLDHADAPGPVTFDPVGAYSVKMAVLDGTRLEFRRTLKFGKDSVPLFDKTAYPTIKRIFDRIEKADNHMLTLKAQSGGPQTAVRE